MNAVAITSIVWTVFWIYWLAATVTARPRQWAWYAGVQLAIVAVVVILLRLNLPVGHAVRGDPWLTGIGLALFALGLALATWARVYLGRNWGTPMSRQAGTDLVTTGPYRAVRHPIYSGVILATIGTALAANVSWLLVAVVLGGYFVFSAVREERYMAERFPDTYPGYKRSTKMLIPCVF